MPIKPVGAPRMVRYVAPRTMPPPGMPGAAMFMSAADYKKIFHDFNISDTAPTTTYCNTGHLASGAWFVVHEILGNKNSKLYAGSMNEWTNLGNPTVGLPG